MESLVVEETAPSGQTESGRRCVTFHEPAPSVRTVVETFSLFSIVRQVHPEPFFSDPSDVPARPREYAGRMFQFQSRTLPYLRPFEHWHTSSSEAADQPSKSPRRRYWQFGPPPPTMLEARVWRKKEKMVEKQRSSRRRARLLSQIERLTQTNDYGFKISQHKATTLVMRDKQHITTLAVEVLTTTRGTLYPDPAFDAIQSIVYSFQNEDENLQDTGSRPDLRTGLILVAGEDLNADRLGLSHLAVEVVEDELELFNTLIDLVRAFDPEIIVGWEIHSSSWGYIIERASKEYEFDLVPQIGRSINDTVTMLNSGERSVAFGPSNTTSTAIARGNPLALVYPTDGTLLMTSPSAILKNSKHPNAAKLFMEFLMSAENAQVMVSYQQESLRPDVAPAPGGKRLDEVKLIRPTEAEIEQGIPKIKELWRDIFGN